MNGLRSRLLDCRSPIEWAHPLNRGIVGCWAVTPLSGWRGGLKLRDLVRGGKNPHDGTLVNGPTWQGPGARPGGYGSLAFASASSQYAVANPFPTTPPPITVAGWFRVGASGGPYGIVSHSPGSNAGWRVTAVNFGSVGSLRFTLASVADYAIPVGSNPMFVGVWNWFAVTVSGNGGTATGYWTTAAGGPLYTGSVAVGTMSGVPTQLFAGTNTSASGEFFNGNVDGPSVHSRCLSDAEVRALYAESKRGYPEAWRWVSTRVYFLPGGAPPSTVFPWWQYATQQVIGGPG